MGAFGRVAGVSLLVAGWLATGTQAQESKSAAAAWTLTQLLHEQRLDAIAARDLMEPDRYVAALYFPGAQLLVVSAPYPVPELLDQRLGNGEYREVYMDLHSASVREGKFFVHDFQANGLQPTRSADQPFDIIYENALTQTVFDGNWAGQKLTATEYRARFETADERYARMLSALIGALRPGT